MEKLTRKINEFIADLSVERKAIGKVLKLSLSNYLISEDKEKCSLVADEVLNRLTFEKVTSIIGSVDIGGLINLVNKIDFKLTSEDKVIKQVMDLEIIRFNGVQRLSIMPGDEVFNLIDRQIKDFIWLYKTGISNGEELNLPNERERYTKMGEDFSKFNDFMRYNMSLKEAN